MDKNRLIILETKCKELQKSNKKGFKNYLINIKEFFNFSNLKNKFNFSNLKNKFNFTILKNISTKKIIFKIVIVSSSLTIIYFIFYNSKFTFKDVSISKYFDWNIEMPSFSLEKLKFWKSETKSETSSNYVIDNNLTQDNNSSDQNLIYSDFKIKYKYLARKEIDDILNVDEKINFQDYIILDYREYEKSNNPTSKTLLNELEKSAIERIVYIVTNKESGSLNDLWFAKLHQNNKNDLMLLEEIDFKIEEPVVVFTQASFENNSIKLLIDDASEYNLIEYIDNIQDKKDIFIQPPNSIEIKEPNISLTNEQILILPTPPKFEILDNDNKIVIDINNSLKTVSKNDAIWDEIYIFDANIDSSSNREILFTKNNNHFIAKEQNKSERNIAIESLSLNQIILPKEQEYNDLNVKPNIAIESLSLNQIILPKEQEYNDLNVKPNIAIESLSLNQIILPKEPNISLTNEQILTLPTPPKFKILDNDNKIVMDINNSLKTVSKNDAMWDEIYIFDANIDSPSNREILFTKNNNYFITKEQNKSERNIAIESLSLNQIILPKEQEYNDLNVKPNIAIESLSLNQIVFPQKLEFKNNKSNLMISDRNLTALEPNLKLEFYESNNSMKNNSSIIQISQIISMSSINLESLIELFSNNDNNNSNNSKKQKIKLPELISLPLNDIIVKKDFNKSSDKIKRVEESELLTLEAIDITSINEEEKNENKVNINESWENFKLFNGSIKPEIETSESLNDSEFKDMEIISTVDEPEPAPPVQEKNETMNQQPNPPVQEKNETMNQQPNPPVQENQNQTMNQQPAPPVQEKNETMNQQPAPPVQENQNQTMNQQPNPPVQENQNQTMNQQPAPPVQENQNQVETSNPVTEKNETVNQQPTQPVQENQNQVATSNPVTEKNETVNQQPTPPVQENQNQVATSNPVTETNQENKNLNSVETKIEENGYNTMFLAPILNL
jgi:hypothetical protein